MRSDAFPQDLADAGVRLARGQGAQANDQARLIQNVRPSVSTVASP